MCIKETITKTKEKASNSVVEDWKKVFFTHSFWLTVASVVLTVVGFVLPYMGFLQPVLSAQTYGITLFVLNVLSAAARFVKQKSTDGEGIL